MTSKYIKPVAKEVKQAVTRKKQPSPRLRRTINALVRRYPLGSVSREELDRIGGSSNGPDLIYRFRRDYIGYDGVVCQKVSVIDRDGLTCKVGQYRLTETGYQRILDQGLHHG